MCVLKSGIYATGGLYLQSHGLPKTYGGAGLAAASQSPGGQPHRQAPEGAREAPASGLSASLYISYHILFCT